MFETFQLFDIRSCLYVLNKFNNAVEYMLNLNYYMLYH